MKISEYIKALQDIQDAHGDLEVERDVGYGRQEALKPSLAFAAILTGRQRNPRFWFAYDPETLRGGKLVRV